RILISFKEKQSDSANKIQYLLQQNNWDDAAKISHMIKGSGGNIGATKLSYEAARLETACNNHNIDEANNILTSLQFSLEQIIESISTLEENNDILTMQPSQEKIDTKLLQSDFLNLLKFLDSDISQAQSKMDKLITMTRDTDIYASTIDLESRLNNFDIDGAREIAVLIANELT
ncbi:MAG: Hpt domain-containing protein, partial [Gammaproteobacteria bacterium]|nr:Hpt domain-containing protein [Gammaproteobacteria bacterium]